MVAFALVVPCSTVRQAPGAAHAQLRTLAGRETAPAARSAFFGSAVASTATLASVPARRFFVDAKKSGFGKKKPAPPPVKNQEVVKTRNNPNAAPLDQASAAAQQPRLSIPQAPPPSFGDAPVQPPKRALISEEAAAKIEETLVKGFVGALLLLLADGILIGISSFDKISDSFNLPPFFDEFAVQFVYPSFTVTMVAFLALASLYGFWKLK